MFQTWTTTQKAVWKKKKKSSVLHQQQRKHRPLPWGLWSLWRLWASRSGVTAGKYHRSLPSKVFLSPCRISRCCFCKACAELSHERRRSHGTDASVFCFRFWLWVTWGWATFVKQMLMYYRINRFLFFFVIIVVYSFIEICTIKKIKDQHFCQTGFPEKEGERIRCAPCDQKCIKFGVCVVYSCSCF